MSAAWKTVPLFISSTFRDMHAERDVLSNVVFPALQEKLRARRCRLEPIDLRVGVETAATQTERERELQILKVCLAEIERSRPFLLVLLGDRYGWVPGEDRISAAAAEAGFAVADAGASVTALEIEYGLLKRDAVQRRRCLLCLRAPLPYETMPAETAAIYSDAHAKDAGATDRARRLEKLKRVILANAELKTHCHPYHMAWDERRLAPAENVIAAWGHSVEAELWKLLDEETRDRVSATEPTWQEEEQFALEEMVERLGSAFVGRKALVREVMNFARSPAREGAPWGLCLTGASGAGKSALFARLHQQLSETSGVLLLANAAGISPRSGQVTWMLRRWIGELALTLGEKVEIPAESKPKDLEELFAKWLHRASASRRVVLLVDALNQFFTSGSSRTLAWLSTPWPANARLVATAIPGVESEVLVRRSGISLLEVPALDMAEAGAVAEQVYAHHHRKPNPEVLRELLALRGKDGVPAAGNPLWLTVALDLLNQLDADDFSAAESAASGSAAEKLGRYVMARARSLPPDIEGLCGVLLARVEKVAGMAETRGFAAMMALSRQGWREQDLAHLLPAAASLMERRGFIWDPLRFAMLRRCFRSHLVKRGALEQWDFAHVSLREAVLGRIDSEWQGWLPRRLSLSLYTCGADYLETLSWDDPLRMEEIMRFLLGQGDEDRVADELARMNSSTFAERFDASLATLVQAILAARDDNFLIWLVELLLGENEGRSQSVAGTFIFSLDSALANSGMVSAEEAREKLAWGVLNTMQRQVDSWPEDQLAKDHEEIAGEMRFSQPQAGKPPSAVRVVGEARAHEYVRFVLATAHAVLAELRHRRGDLVGALDGYRESAEIKNSLHDAGPGLGKQINQLEIGDVLLSQGDLAGALKVFRGVHDALAPFALDLFADLQYFFASTKCRIGDVLFKQGDALGALENYREALVIQERVATAEAKKSFSPDPAEVEAAGGLEAYLARGDHGNIRVSSHPSDEDWEKAIMQTYENMGEALRAKEDVRGALECDQAALSVVESLATGDPSRMEWQHRIGVLQRKIAMDHYLLGQPQEALEAAQLSCAALERLLAAYPTSQQACYELGMSHGWVADALTMAGNHQEALEIFRELVKDFEYLLEQDPTDTQWQDFLAMCRDRVRNLEAGPKALAGSRPSPATSRPAALPPKESGIEDLRRSAGDYMKRGLWEAAATVWEKLLAQGAPLADCGPKLITCLLSAHTEVLPGDAEKIEKLAAQLDAAGHPELAAEVRAQLAARQHKPPPRPWWKVW